MRAIDADALIDKYGEWYTEEGVEGRRKGEPMKYIIEFEDEPFMYEDGMKFYKCVQVPYYSLSERIIKSLTPYRSERKKGKWLPDINNYYEERFICSVCGKSYKVDTCCGEPMWNFCPCGADMRGEQDESN